MTAVFLAGGADPGTVWNALVDALGPEVLTCRFDRPGVAPSYVPTQLVTPQFVSDALAQTLDQADLGARVMFVGHSLGGVSVRVFGGDHPERVAAALFLDPTVPSFATGLAASELQQFGWAPALTEAQGDAVTKWASDVPIRVLSHDPAQLVPSVFTQQQQDDWELGQKVYAALSSKGSQEDVPGASHYVFVSAQDVVAQAVVDTLAIAQP